MSKEQEDKHDKGGGDMDYQSIRDYEDLMRGNEFDDKEEIRQLQSKLAEKNKRIRELESCLSKILIELEGGYLKGPDKSIEYARKALEKS